MVEIIETEEELTKKLGELAFASAKIIIDIGKGNFKGAKDIYENLELYFTDTQIRLLATNMIVQLATSALHNLDIRNRTTKKNDRV